MVLIKTNKNNFVTHNHVTRDIKPLGQCPSCDLYHNRNKVKHKKVKKDETVCVVDKSVMVQAFIKNFTAKTPGRWFVIYYPNESCLYGKEIQKIFGLSEPPEYQDDQFVLIKSDKYTSTCPHSLCEAVEKHKVSCEYWTRGKKII